MEPTTTPDPSVLPIPEKEHYTYEDYAQLPEGASYELIRGTLVMSPSPSAEHQRILRRLAWSLQQYIDEEGQGEVFFAPMDVYLSKEDTPQPDLISIAEDRLDIIGEQKIEEAPDLVVEILSPSTAYRDLTTKKRLYEEHGVQEYWTVDPASKAVEVFTLTDGRFIQHARLVEDGTAASKLLDGFQIDLANLFHAASA